MNLLLVLLFLSMVLAEYCQFLEKSRTEQSGCPRLSQSVRTEGENQPRLFEWLGLENDKGNTKNNRDRMDSQDSAGLIFVFVIFIYLPAMLILN